jgi:hypothetical protein
MYGRVKSKSTFGMRTKWSYRDVLQLMHREELNDLAAKISGSLPGTSSYIGSYKAAFKEIEADLSEELRVKYKAEARKWTDEKPPHSEQCRYVNTNCSSRSGVSNSQTSMLGKHGMRTFHDFAESVYSQYGMRIVIFGGYKDRDGDPAITW